MATDTPCRTDPDMWFSTNRTKIRKAKILCSQCPLRAACAADAISNGERHGVWGGLDETQLRQRRRRGDRYAAIVNPPAKPQAKPRVAA